MVNVFNKIFVLAPWIFCVLWWYASSHVIT
jgi:hypothetical protein